jgi:hypothetical protein
MEIMLVLGFFGTLCYSFRKILESSDKNELEKHRIDSKSRIDCKKIAALERMYYRNIQESVKIAEIKQNTALLNCIQSRQEIAYFQGEFEKAASLKYEYDNLRKLIRGSSRD